MKIGIIFALVAALSVVFLVEWASARGNHRSAIDRKWKEVQAWQEQQNKKFRAIEREAERSIRHMNGSKSQWYIVPSNGYQRQCP
jgi:hypothetical protein